MVWWHTTLVHLAIAHAFQGYRSDSLFHTTKQIKHMFLSIAVDVVAFFTTPLPPAFHFLVKSFGCFTLSAFFSSLVLSTFLFSARDFFLSFLPFLIYYGVARQKAILIQFMCWFGLQLITIRGFENIFYCSVPGCVWCGGFIRLDRDEHRFR